MDIEDYKYVDILMVPEPVYILGRYSWQTVEVHFSRAKHKCAVPLAMSIV